VSVHLLPPSVALNRRFVLPADAAPASGDQPASGPQARRAFRLGRLTLLLQEQTVAEVMDLPACYRLPNTPAWCLGLVNLRGNLLPAFDLHGLLEEAPVPAAACW